MTDRPTCSVIIVNWNGRHLLGPCLQSLQQQTFADFEIILVDNASSDGSPEWVAQHYPGVRLRVNERNLGFAEGNNVGLAAARGEFAVLLNNDTEAEPGFLAGLLEAARADERIGMVAGVLVFAHRPDTIASAGIRMQRDGVALDEMAGRPRRELPSEPREVFGPSGGAALYRRAMLEQVGAFEPAYFFYLEDVDLAWRGRLAGWRCQLAPSAVVRHVYSASAGQGSPFKSFQLARNRWLVLFLNLPAGLWLRYAPLILAYDLAACGYGLLARDWEIWRGRGAALRLLPALRRRRRAVQQLRQVPLDALRQLLAPPLAPWTTLRLRRQISRLAQATET
ncbi:MAG: glycosyltransferase family 2 protein [Chloroflexia bacterium]|nr:glycosyltransferase family 2 protein [Chloroflexia bacterium]